MSHDWWGGDILVETGGGGMDVEQSGVDWEGKKIRSVKK